MKVPNTSPKEMQPHFRVCNLCEAMCGIEVTPIESDNGKAVKLNIRPDQNDPFSKGR